MLDEDGLPRRHLKNTILVFPKCTSFYLAFCRIEESQNDFRTVCRILGSLETVEASFAMTWADCPKS